MGISTQLTGYSDQIEKGLQKRNQFEELLVVSLIALLAITYRLQETKPLSSGISSAPL